MNPSRVEIAKRVISVGRFSRTARKRRVRRQQREAILLGSAIRGCTCTPNLRHYRHDGMQHVDVMHDDDCPAMDTGTQYVFTRGHR